MKEDVTKNPLPYASASAEAERITLRDLIECAEVFTPHLLAEHYDHGTGEPSLELPGSYYELFAMCAVSALKQTYNPTDSREANLKRAQRIFENICELSSSISDALLLAQESQA